MIVASGPLQWNFDAASDLVVLEVRIKPIKGGGDRFGWLELNRASKTEALQLGRPVVRLFAADARPRRVDCMDIAALLRRSA